MTRPNPEKDKQLRLQKKEHIKETNRIWYLKNKETISQKNKEYKKNNPERRRDIELRSIYGISLLDYNTLVAQQDNRCAICKSIPAGKLVIDHCHKTNKIRGLLCRTCNIGIGHLNDSIEQVESALMYLRNSL